MLSSKYPACLLLLKIESGRIYVQILSGTNLCSAFAMCLDFFFSPLINLKAFGKGKEPVFSNWLT